MQTDSRLTSAKMLLNVLVAGLLLTIPVLFPQTCNAQPGEPSETIRVDSNLVDLRVSVVRLNPNDPVSALQQKDFTIFEDGKPQEIVFFAGEDAPFDLVLLLDLSGSSSDKIKLIRSSAKRFIESTRPMDRVAIVTFTDMVEVVSPLTWDRGLLKDSLQDIQKPLGGTNFWDSLLFTMTRVISSEKSFRRSAIVVMTDGVDNALPDVYGDGSRTTFAELLDRVGRSGTIVFPIYLDTEAEGVKRNRVPVAAYTLARSQLAQLAAASGTKMYRANKLKDLDLVYDQVIKDLSVVYSLAYKPSNEAQDGKWRSVGVQLIGRQDLTATTKRGYFAKAEP
ncbi:MAG: VWA domain-containing protein [Pyrinomonadaceae bacterium]|nr:VWA domain-containing protein [Pyrinomonadaceae bacterium]